MDKTEFRKKVLELNGLNNRSVLLEEDNLILIKETTNGYNDFYLYQNKNDLIELLFQSDDIKYIYKEFDYHLNNDLNDLSR